MKDKISKQEAVRKIDDFFSNLDRKTGKEIKKIKRFSMHYHISLNKYKSLYCKKCFSVFNAGNSEIRIKKGFKIVKCKKCGNIQRKRIK
ncbi:MAG: hypothetical protein AABY22_30680 [Nanoarchaeota archaeon]